MEKLQEKYRDSEQLEWNRDNDNFEVLRKSDILISDFSGVLFDYALVFDKPVIYTNEEFDKAPYDCAWIDDELWTFEILPKIGRELDVSMFPKIKEVIDECIESPEFEKGRNEARKETWVHPGEGAKRTVDYIETLLN
jgi:CDP-glycerol glycerophosphotransferase (TagB/SpsB family)